jgi:hypothetical protein
MLTVCVLDLASHGASPEHAAIAGRLRPFPKISEGTMEIKKLTLHFIQRSRTSDKLEDQSKFSEDCVILVHHPRLEQ